MVNRIHCLLCMKCSVDGIRFCPFTSAWVAADYMYLHAVNSSSCILIREWASDQVFTTGKHKPFFSPMHVLLYHSIKDYIESFWLSICQIMLDNILWMILDNDLMVYRTVLWKKSASVLHMSRFKMGHPTDLMVLENGILSTRGTFRSFSLIWYWDEWRHVRSSNPKGGKFWK